MAKGAGSKQIWQEYELESPGSMLSVVARFGYLSASERLFK
jgi:hypothetical protein